MVLCLTFFHGKEVIAPNRKTGKYPGLIHTGEERKDLHLKNFSKKKEGRMKTFTFVLSGLFFFLLSSPAAFPQKDRQGCQDHPMFTRMPNFYIFDCKEKEFDRAEFKNEKGEVMKVEGKLHFTDYRIKDGVKAPSSLQIVRNYQNAVKSIGGTVVYEDLHYYDTYFKLNKGGKTFWILVDANSTGNGKDYELTILEKAEMAQEIVADAKSLMRDIHTTGHASVYGIYFDFNKAEIKPDSQAAIREIAKLLQQNSQLKLLVVGHTDNVGGLDYNLKLSKARADAVVKELTTKYKIPADRLQAYGVGSLAPVASNDSEEGRAKNRRVELVKP
jgi:outer membrane protein OmpA-like peptidoglycan-associated protein